MEREDAFKTANESLRIR